MQIIDEDEAVYEVTMEIADLEAEDPYNIDESQAVAALQALGIEFGLLEGTEAPGVFRVWILDPDEFEMGIEESGERFSARTF